MIKALIIDDDLSAASVLQLMLQRHVSEIADIRIATKIKEASVLIQQFKPDLVFQDIVMPEKNGFEFLSAIENINFDIVFTTAYHEYAIRAIRFSALDYLLKPINTEELINAVNRFLEKRSKQQDSDLLLKNLIANLEQKKESDFKLAVPTINGAMFLVPSQIIRLEGESNYTRFFLDNNQKHLSAKTMKEYEEILLQHNFIRIHKSHLINKKFVENYLNEGTVILKDNVSLPVSRLRKAQVAALLRK
ncbi:MAG TPA: LytTR family DNA-binding domain-containing protein [Ferruginibacter sp.]|nr:LytTR family DNA-binding domain-containing protein [Ferruginibacter sp.]HRE64321.1 LytTR family DNA-binding domain-containing protein [Ferruginibacter sp.]